MFCDNCGNKLEKNASFCSECGNKIVLSGKISKKNQKNRVIILSVAVILGVAVGILVFMLIKYFTNGGDVPSQTEFEEMDGVVEEQFKAVTNPSTSLNDLVFVLEGVEYRFPLQVKDLLADGWTLDDYNSKVTVESGQKESVYLVCGNSLIDVDIYNPSNKDMSIEECYVGELGVKWADVVLPCNICPGVSTRLDIKKAYGMPEEHLEHVLWYYGELDEDNEDLFLSYPVNNEKPVITLKFSEDCAEDGPKDGDLLLYADIQFFDPQAHTKPNPNQGG